MKLSIKDYLMIIITIIVIIIWIIIIENTKYNNDKSIINKKFCLEISEKDAYAISNCNRY